jgi:hypothetical protein
MASRGRARRFWRHPATAAGLALLGLLLFLWPFVRQPRPGLSSAWVEVMAAWAVGVAVLFRVSRRREPPAPEAGRDG